MTDKSHQRIACFVLLIAFLVMTPIRIVSLPATQDLEEFHQRVQKYAQLHKRIAGNLPSINRRAEPTQIAAHRNAMAEALRAARPQAQQGDLFFEGISQYVVKLIHSEMKGVQGTPARQMIKDGNPKVVGNPEKFTVQVNAIYPDGAPLSAVPPSLLQKLPALPPELDYRFVGRDLILRDIDANIIVDYIAEAAPPR